MGPYAGDLDVNAVWTLLRSDRSAVLVDVRTSAEWSFVGLPDLRSLGKRTILIEWQVYPTMQQNDAFLDRLQSETGMLDLPAGAPLLFICRSGARSRAAAILATEAGHPTCYNVADGFEGPLGPDGHRGVVAGWKASGLPWIQT